MKNKEPYGKEYLDQVAHYRKALQYSSEELIGNYRITHSLKI